MLLNSATRKLSSGLNSHNSVILRRMANHTTHRITVVIEVDPLCWQTVYGEHPTDDRVQAYVLQALAESGAAAEGAVVSAEEV